MTRTRQRPSATQTGDMTAADEARREHIRKVVDAAPPLTPEQRDRLAALLRPTAGRQ